MNGWQNAARIVEKLNNAGFAAYFVGGCVRDRLMKRPPSDIDITTAAAPEQVKALFDRTADTGLKHGTVTVILGKDTFEVTTFRTESDYENHRKPKSVSFVTDIRQDLARRDFTVNAMAYHPEEGLIDPFGGEKDIQNQILRCVGNAEERFEEDALRMLRCVRFACQTGFSVEEKTLEAIRNKAALLQFISAERIYTEVIKSLVSDYPERIRLAYETGLMQYFLPELSLCFETPQNTKYHLYDVGEHILKAVEACPKDKNVRLSALLHDVAKPLCRTTDESGADHFKGHEKKSAELAHRILTRLKADNKTKKSVCSVIEHHRWEKIPEPLTVKEKILAVGKENFPMLLFLMEADTKAHNPEYTRKRASAMQAVRQIYEQILENREPLCISDLALNGADLMKLGYGGTEIGDALNRALGWVLEQPACNTVEFLTERLKKK